mgnify:CR=1 FL=1
MKRLILPLLLLAALLCACAETAAPTAAPTEIPTEIPTETASAAADPSEATEAALPAECSLYYDLNDAPLTAERDSDLPPSPYSAAGISDAVRFWANALYNDTTINDEKSVELYTDGRAKKGDGWRRFVWNDERYSCLYIEAADTYIPNISSEDGGILWLDLTGDCWADGGGGDEMADLSLFEGFTTIVLTGSGTFRVDCAGLGNTAGELPLPALVIDGPTLVTPGLSVSANADPAQPGLVLRGGDVQVETLWLNDTPLLQSGGTLNITTCIDPATAVFRGGECTLESLVREDEAPATLILSGGSFTETDWLPFGTIAYVGAGTLNARGIRYWDTVHVLGGEIVDPLDWENETEG